MTFVGVIAGQVMPMRIMAGPLSPSHSKPRAPRGPGVIY